MCGDAREVGERVVGGAGVDAGVTEPWALDDVFRCSVREIGVVELPSVGGRRN